MDDNGEEHTTSETFATQKEAEKRKNEIEYKQSIGKFEVPQEPVSLPWKSVDEALKDFWKYLDGRQRE